MRNAASYGKGRTITVINCQNRLASILLLSACVSTVVSSRAWLESLTLRLFYPEATLRITLSMSVCLFVLCALVTHKHSVDHVKIWYTLRIFITSFRLLRASDILLQKTFKTYLEASFLADCTAHRINGSWHQMMLSIWDAVHCGALGHCRLYDHPEHRSAQRHL